MKNFQLVLILFILLTTFSGCAYNAKVESTSAPVSEIRQDKKINDNVSYFIDDDVSTLNKKIKASTYMCSAHNFPLDAGDALKSSIVKVLDGTFTGTVHSSSKVFSKGDGKFKFIFSLESFDPKLRFSQGFWQATISSTTEVSLKVIIVDADGKEITRTTIFGEGSADSEGQCGDGAQVLADSTNKAIKRMLENFVHKIINSDYLKPNAVTSDKISSK